MSRTDLGNNFRSKIVQSQKYKMTKSVVKLKRENTMSGGANLASRSFDADTGEKHPHDLLGQIL